jgi:hypothetical protein
MSFLPIYTMSAFDLSPVDIFNYLRPSPPAGEVLFLFSNGATAAVSTKKLFESSAKNSADTGDTTLTLNLEGKTEFPLRMNIRSHPTGKGGNGNKSKFELTLGGIFLVVSALAATQSAGDTIMRFCPILCFFDPLCETSTPILHSLAFFDD